MDKLGQYRRLIVVQLADLQEVATQVLYFDFVRVFNPVLFVGLIFPLLLLREKRVCPFET